MNIELKSFKEELPKLSYWSSSYGGHWSSEWIVIVTPDADFRTTKFLVSWSRENEPVSEETIRLTGKIHTRPWYRYSDCFWAYSKDIKEHFGVEE
jgi:hypothetical protein